MSSDTIPGPTDTPRGMEDMLRFARLHGESTDTRQWVDNLERMLAVDWDIMSEDQQRAFREHADVLAIAEAAGETPSSA